ncbi:hypothetical protein STCU_10454 [Strigomonas culicis]|uniref:Uncharacterized protein n=1 Tax=Strigomonas culicis TaxID=28005 RepID=S9V4C3_9TRYP|nr:hypothetical protein STCU_10454 [Strigomonas culicis]|eukprot:EPY17710.1 hypothetical protein STCU_10454 [Strigomonas culicis]
MSRTPEKDVAPAVPEHKAPAPLTATELQHTREQRSSPTSPHSQPVLKAETSPSAVTEKKKATGDTSPTHQIPASGVVDPKPASDHKPHSSHEMPRDKPLKEKEPVNTSAAVEKQNGTVRVQVTSSPAPAVPVVSDKGHKLKLSEEEATSGVYVYCANATVHILE